MDILLLVIVYLAGALSAEGVRRTARKMSGGRFFERKTAPVLKDGVAKEAEKIIG